MKLGIVFTLLSLLMIIPYQFMVISAFAENIQNSDQSVIEFDVPYELFAALSDYHDLTQSEEKRHLVIDEEIIPVIAEIIYSFEEEQQKYLNIQNISDKVKNNLEKMDAHLIDFRNELLFRRKVVEFRTLLEKQQKLKLNQ
ncbi:MAG: hypothetical protein QM487_12445 [Candidatus Marithrix sp.]